MIKKVLIYFAFITATLYGLRYLHYQGLLKNTSGYYEKYRIAFLEKNNHDFLFLGSSRAELHYNTRIFDSLTGFNSFNLSLQGATPHMAFAALKAYLVNSATPEYIVYEVDYHALKEEPVPFYDFNNYFPFLKNTVLRQEFQSIDNRTNLFYALPYASFPFTGYKNISTSLHGWLNMPEEGNFYYYKGTIFTKQVDTLKFEPSNAHYSFILPNNRRYIDSIIGYCKSKDIKLILCTSPAFGGFRINLKNKNQLVEQVENIAKTNGLPYYNFSETWFCADRKLFGDFFHMNPNGGALFTRELVTALAIKPSKTR